MVRYHEQVTDKQMDHCRMKSPGKETAGALAPKARNSASSSSEPTLAERPDITHCLVTSDLFDRILFALKESEAEGVNFFVFEEGTMQKLAVIASGRSAEHVHQLANLLSSMLANDGLDALDVEGIPECDWVLIDATNVVFHIFRPEVRAYYNFEEIWSPADLKGIELAIPNSADVPNSSRADPLSKLVLELGLFTAIEMFKEMSDFLRDKKYVPSHRSVHTSQQAYSIEMLSGLCCFMAISPLFDIAIAKDQEVSPLFISKYSETLESNKDSFFNCSILREGFVKSGKLYGNTTEDWPLSHFITTSLFIICYRAPYSDNITLNDINTDRDPDLLNYSNHITHLLTRHLSHVRNNLQVLLGSHNSQIEQILHS